MNQHRDHLVFDSNMLHHKMNQEWAGDVASVPEQFSVGDLCFICLSQHVRKAVISCVSCVMRFAPHA